MSVIHTPKQISALKNLILYAKDGTDLTKKVLTFLIDQSEGLTKEVCLTLTESCEGYDGKEIHYAAVRAGDMNSSNPKCSTRLDLLFQLMESQLYFSAHYGDFDPTRSDNPLNCDGMFVGSPAHWQRIPGDEGLYREGMPLRYTFWLQRQPCGYSHEAKLLPATREELEKIELLPKDERPANS